MTKNKTIDYYGTQVICKTTNELKPSTNCMDSAERILQISAVSIAIDNLQSGECVVVCKCLASGTETLLWSEKHLECITHYHLKKIRKNLNALIADKVLKDYRERIGVDDE